MKKMHLPLVLLLAFSMLLVACGPQAPVEAPVVEAPPVEEPAAPVEPEEAALDLDAAFEPMITDIAAEGYYALKDMALLNEMLSSDTPPFLLDVREVSELEEKGHIGGAVNIPLRELAQNLELLPSFDTPIVVYCGSGWRAAIAMTALYSMGWTDVVTFHPPSYGGWVEQGYATVAGAAPEAMVLNAAQPGAAIVAAMDEMLASIPEGWGVITADVLTTEIIENPDLIVIDVRKEAEVGEGTIDAPNLDWVTLDDFINLQDQWPADLDAPIAIYCKAGHRSTVAMTILMSYGYTNVRSLKGGFVGWEEAGYATIGGEPTLKETYSTMLTNMTGYNTVKAEDLLVELAEDQPPFLLDVRSAAELEEKGYIPGATHIPLNELAQHLDLLPGFDTPIVTYCAGGWRATIAMTALHAMGWTNVRALKVTFDEWITAGNPVEAGIPEPMVLDVVQVGEGLTAPVDTAVNIAKDTGWGGKAAEALNTELIEKPDMILIDVRTPEELTEKGVIAVEGQELLAIPMESFIADGAMWPADKDAEIVIYCGSGHRSTMAMTILLTEGYTNVTSLKGGFGGWVEAGYPAVEYAAP